MRPRGTLALAMPALVLSCLLCLAPPSCREASACSVIFHDDFNGTLEPGWSWIRENPATWWLTPTSLHIESEYGDLWSTWTNNCRNLLIRPAPPADFRIEAHLVANLAANVNQALIVLYANDDNYLRFGLLKGTGALYVNHVHEVGGGPQPQTYDYGAGDIYLRVEKIGMQATMWFSFNGTDWTQHLPTIASLGFTPANVGLVAFDGSEPASASVVDYDWFTILSEPLSGVGDPAGTGRQSTLVVRGNPAEAGRPLHIDFVTPDAGPVNLRLFDATGALVATLMDGELPPGSHTATWTGAAENGWRPVRAGVYFLSLTAGRTRSTSRVVLVR